MLRLILLAIGALSILAGIALGPFGGGSGTAAVVWGAILILALLVERFRYRRLSSKRPGPEFKPTNERFIDHESGATVTVWERADTGERAYVKD